MSDKTKGKDAIVKVDLKADTGYRANLEGRITAEQWGRIVDIINEKESA